MKESYSFVTTRLIRLFEGNCVFYSSIFAVAFAQLVGERPYGSGLHLSNRMNNN